MKTTPVPCRVTFFTASNSLSTDSLGKYAVGSSRTRTWPSGLVAISRMARAIATMARSTGGSAPTGVNGSHFKPNWESW